MSAAVPQTLSALIDMHYAFIYRYAHRLCGHTTDAEDLTQQTFLSAQASLSQLRELGKARAWLCAITRNAYLRQRRQPVRCVPLLESEEPLDAATPECPEQVDPEKLQIALNELPEEFRSPVILFYFEGVTYREIAEALGVPVGTVMSRLSRAKHYLRERLQRTCESPVVMRNVGVQGALAAPQIGPGAR